MSLSGLGDGARTHVLLRDGARMKSDLQRLTTELASGKHADLGRANGGDFSRLSDLRQQLRLSTVQSEILAEAQMTAGARQAALDRVSAALDGIAPGLMAAATTGNGIEIAARLADAPGRLEDTIAAINTRLGGRGLFSGDRPDQPALASAEVILDALRPLASAAPDADSLIAAVDAWFQDAGGGFETVALTGGQGSSPPVLLQDGRQIETDVPPSDPALRSALSGLALATLAAEGVRALAPGSQQILAQAAASRIQDGSGGLIDLRAGLGDAEARLESARVDTEARRTGLSIEETGITSADPYRTAAELEAVRQNLDSLYLITARLARLSLSEYLR